MIATIDVETKDDKTYTIHDLNPVMTIVALAQR